MVIATRANPRADLHVVRKLEAGIIADDVRRQYEERFGNPPEKPGGWYRDDDWWRTTFVLDRPRMPSMIIEERVDDTPFDDVPEGNAASSGRASPSGKATGSRARRPVTDLDQAQRRTAELEQEVERLRNRKALRAANWLGATARRVRRALPWR